MDIALKAVLLDQARTKAIAPSRVVVHRTKVVREPRIKHVLRTKAVLPIKAGLEEHLLREAPPEVVALDLKVVPMGQDLGLVSVLVPEGPLPLHLPKRWMG